MTKTRLEAFSDGVIAIIITIMVLELKVPHDTTHEALMELLPLFLSYLLSFIYVAIYWGNHHHLLHAVSHVTSSIIWSNLHLLFWLSLVPFVTAYMGENHFETLPVALYGFVMLMCGMAYYILLLKITKHSKMTPVLELAIRKQTRKGFISLIAYLIAVPVAFYSPLISSLAFIGNAVMWLIPDRNIEKALKD